MNRKYIYVAAAVFAVLLGKSVTSVFAIPAGDVPKAYCHAAGQTGTTHFNYHFNKAWTAHFLDNGDPRAGHESDFYTTVGDKDCDRQVDPTPTPEPCIEECQSPSPEPEPEQDDACLNLEDFQESVPEGYIVDREDNCVPEPTPTPLACSGTQHLDASGKNCVDYQLGGPGPSTETGGGQVLGATTMAKTGSFAENLYLAIMTLGGLFTFKGLKKSFKKA